MHRRGLDSLRDFWTTTLPAELEPEALDWLQLQSVVPWSTGADGFSPRGVLDEALSAYADAIGEPEPLPAFPPVAISPSPLSWLDASASAPLEEAEPLPAPLSAPLPPPPEPLLRSAPARARRLVSRTRVLLRDCLEEVWDGLAGSSAAGRLEAAEDAEVSETPEAGAAAEARQTATPPLAELPLPAEPSPPAQLPLASTTLVPPRSAPVPPLPAFPLSASAVPPEKLQPRPRLTVPRLPRATRPAPAPADLADLRMWLPDPNEDLRRAS